MNLGETISADPVRPVGADGGTVATLRVAWGWIALLGFGHLIIELGSSFALTRTLDDTDLGAGAVLAYNAIAFWGQPLLGWAADHWRGAKVAAIAGTVWLVAGLLSLGVVAPWVAVALIALGNGCYHVGGGVLAIQLSRGRVGGLGLFVGPGAVGLTLGVGLARMDFVATPWALGVLVALLAAMVWRIGRRRSSLPGDSSEVSSNQAASRCQTMRAEAAHYAQALGGAAIATDRLQAGSCTRIPLALAIALVLGCIAIRSFVGSGFAFSWGGSATAALAVAAALAGGKIGGGFLADRFGWLATTLAVLALSVPALWFGQTSMPAGLLGVALFQAPMAVTLGAMVWALPRRPGVAFGLASAFVYVGGFPLPGGEVRWLHSFAGLSCLSLAAAVMLAAALLRGRRWRGERPLVRSVNCRDGDGDE